MLSFKFSEQSLRLFQICLINFIRITLVKFIQKFCKVHFLIERNLNSSICIHFNAIESGFVNFLLFRRYPLLYLVFFLLFFIVFINRYKCRWVISGLTIITICFLFCFLSINSLLQPYINYHIYSPSERFSRNIVLQNHIELNCLIRGTLINGHLIIQNRKCTGIFMTRLRLICESRWTIQSQFIIGLCIVYFKLTTYTSNTSCCLRCRNCHRWQLCINLDFKGLSFSSDPVVVLEDIVELIIISSDISLVLAV